MIRAYLLFFLMLAGGIGLAQETGTSDPLEWQSDSDEGLPEDDSYLQSLEHFRRHPLDVNQATETDLQEFLFLTPLQIRNFLKYRTLTGKFISLYELQAIPLWTFECIQKILPYVKSGPAQTLIEDWGERWKNGEYVLLGRTSFQTKWPGDKDTINLVPGGREQVMIRMHYRFRNNFQWGVTAEKDAGEQWFRGSQRGGFDFYSFHLFARNTGKVKAIAIGDHIVNLGQGLIQWQGLAFRKNTDVLQVKRQGAGIRPYHSAGEALFQRGVGLVLGIKNYSLTLFVSSRKMDGSPRVDTVTGMTFLTGFQTSGLHRTESEQKQKNTWTLQTTGFSIRTGNEGRHLSLQAIRYQFSLPLDRPQALYHLYSYRGRNFINMSVEGGYTWRQLHCFGELAMHNGHGLAFLGGCLASLDPKVSVSMVVRNLSQRYQTLFGNAFTESSQPTNERGVFAGISIRPVARWKIEGFVDVYRFPWLRYRISAPSAGGEYVIQLTHQPSKKIEIQARVRKELRQNDLPRSQEDRMALVLDNQRISWRSQIQMKISPDLLWRCRIESVSVRFSGNNPERGFLVYADWKYHPMQKPFSIGFRWQYYDTEGYNSRIYAYENDVLYRFSILPFSGYGSRYYLNLQYDAGRKTTCWLRWAHTISGKQSTEGISLAEDRRFPELRVQVVQKF